MSPSRRTLLRSVAAAIPLVVAGCTTSASRSAPEASTSAETNSPVGNPAGGFEVRLDGPDTDHLLVGESGISSIAEVRKSRSGGYVLPVELSADATAGFSTAMRSADVADSPDEYEIVLYSDGDTINRLGVSPGFAQTVNDGDWDGELVLHFESREQAVEIRRSLTND